MSLEYFWFVACYTLALVIASLVVFRQRGQRLTLATMRRVGRRMGLGPWGLLHAFGYRADTSGLSPSGCVEIAESHIASAESQTLVAARITVWVLISGCVFTAITGVVVSGALLPLVESGAWSRELFRRSSQWLVRVDVAGGLAMGIGLVWWLWERVVRLNRSEGCSVARGLVVSAQNAALESELTTEIAAGAYPRVKGLLSSVI